MADSTGANATVTSNQVPAGGFNVIATYSGDSQYATNKNQTYFTVGPEEGTLSAAIAGAVPLGGTIVVTISDKSTSGVGTPSVTGYVIPQGISNPQTYSVPLTGTNGTASGTVSVPASIAGSVTLLVGCTSSDPNFTCYNSLNVTATVNKATPTATLKVLPSPLVNGLPAQLTMTITGATGQVAPTGSIIYYDNGVNIGQGGVTSSSNTSTISTQNINTATAHSFTATYYGDNNYVGVGASANSTGTSASTTTLTVSPNPPVSGSTTTLTATIVSGTSTTTAVPTGTVTFYQDGVALSPTATVSPTGVAMFTSTVLSGTTAHTYYAVYSGDTNYQTSQSANVPTAAAGAVASTTTLTVSPNPPVSGSTTTLHAVIASGSTSTTAVPTGTVTFYQDGVALSPTVAVSATGTADYTSTTLSSVTAHTYYASYGGNTTYTASMSASVPTSASVAGSTTTTLTVSPNPPVAGSLTTLTATIASTANGSATPTGTVTFYQDGLALSPAATVVNGTTATYTSTALSTAVAHRYTATYSGDTKYITSTSVAVVTTPANVGSTSTTVAINQSAAGSGLNTTLTATLAYVKNGTTTPTGTVTFYQDGVALSPSIALAGTSAVYNTLAITNTVAHSYTAVYNGDTNYTASTSPAVTTPAAAAGTTTTSLTVSPNPPVVSNTTTLTATVAATAVGSAVPTGTVTFYQDGVALSPTATLVNGTTATYQSFNLDGSTAHTYTAIYSGDTNYTTSTSAGVATAANPGIVTFATMTIAPNPPVLGTTTTLTTTLGTLGVVTVAPTGTVTFYQDGVALSPTATVQSVLQAGNSDPVGVATYTNTALSGATPHSFTSKYSGSSIFASSVSPALSTAGGVAGTTTTSLVVSPNPPVAGSTTTLTATIAATANGSAVPTGTVTFYQDGVALSPAATVVSGTTATYTSSTLSGTTAHSYTAKYSGDTSYTTSTSSAVATAAATAGATALTLGVNPNPPVLGTTTTLTASLSYTANGSTVPTGTVTFYDNGVALSPAATVVSGTTATYTSTTISGATAHSFTAKYSGDTSYAASTSAAVPTTSTNGMVASTITISATPTTIANGATTNLTATVASGSTTSTAVPTGLVEFFSSTQGLLGTANVNASGVATLSPILTTTGTITATYVGDSTYTSSTTATGALVTVTGSTASAAITLTISPSPAIYGGTVTLTTTITAVPVTGSVPAGTITWTLVPNAGGTAVIYTAALSATSSTTATASTTISAPAVGTYTVTATCAGTNITCSTLTISKGFAVVKTGTSVTLDAEPNPPVAGQPEVLTAYIAGPGNVALGAACTGLVTFYVNGASAGTAAVSGNQAVYVVTLPLPTKNVLYAVYSGDTNCSTSVSTTTTLTQPPAATTTTLTANSNPALYTANEVLTVVVSAVPTATNTNPGYPTGTVTFYDTFNGLSSILGTATLTQNGPYSSLGQFSTTGLLAGNHTILAIYSGATAFSTSQADVISVAITDFTTTFAPSSSTVASGGTVTALATVVPVNGFGGQVVLGCVPPAGSATTCSFSPAVLSAGGVSTLTITTTKTTGSLRWNEATGGLTFALGILGLLWPGRRRKLPFALAIILSLGLVGSVGCTTVRSEGLAASTSGSGTGTSGGTPTGTLQFSITASGTDGKTVNSHSLKYFVTVQ